VLVHELERVPVAGADDDLHALRAGLAGQRADDVVRLVPRQLDHRDLQRGQHLLDQADLALERRRGLRPVRLVLPVLLGPEGLPGHVEGHHDVRRLLVAQHVYQHRGEAEHGVGRLAGGGREVLHRQGEERPVRQGMSVQEQHARGRVRHGRNSSPRL
jgi:hypothetical protein